MRCSGAYRDLQLDKAVVPHCIRDRHGSFQAALTHAARYPGTHPPCVLHSTSYRASQHVYSGIHVWTYCKNFAAKCGTDSALEVDWLLTGKQMVLWRDGEQQWRCFEDSCPHRCLCATTCLSLFRAVDLYLDEFGGHTIPQQMWYSVRLNQIINSWGQELQDFEQPFTSSLSLSGKLSGSQGISCLTQEGSPL